MQRVRYLEKLKSQRWSMSLVNRHREKAEGRRGDPGGRGALRLLDCFASLAMTTQPGPWITASMGRPQERPSL
jgi:hypothetical protein